MPAYSSLNAKVPSSFSQTTEMSSAPTPPVMNGTRLMRNSSPQATSAAHFVMKFIYDGTQLPPFLAQHVGFFTGLVTGALGGFALHRYIQHNRCDKAKVKLAIHHILRVIQEDYSYCAMLQDPQKLLLRIETEVMRLVDKHLTQKEATQVTKGVKRSFSKIPNISFDEVAHKRVREDYRDVVKERQEPAFATAHQKQLRGFLDPSENELTYQEYVPGLRTTSKAIYQTPFETAGCHDSLQEEPDVDLGLEEDLMVIDKAIPSSSGIPSVPDHLFGGSSCPAARLHNPSSAHQSIFSGRADTPVTQPDKEEGRYEPIVDSTEPSGPASVVVQVAGGLRKVGGIKPPLHAPEVGSFGLDYEDSSLYSDEEDDLQPSGPPPTVRQCGGVKCSGTQLSPILASPWPTEDLPAAIAINSWSTEAELEFSSSGSERTDSSLASFGVNMSTMPEPEYSSSGLGSPEAITTSPRSSAPSPEPTIAATAQEDVFASVEPAGGPQTSSPENPSPSRKRKSASPSPTSPSKRVRISLSPLTDVSNDSPTPSRRASTPPIRKPTPLRKGRRYGLSRPFHIEQAEQPGLKTPQRKVMRAAAKTPATATRKSSRIEGQKKMKDEQIDEVISTRGRTFRPKGGYLSQAEKTTEPKSVALPGLETQMDSS